VEKPLARTARDAQKLAKVAAKARGMAMCAMCMRFWPGWTWLKEAVSSRRYGRVLSADFRRIASHPGGKFYCDGAACGGGILDLHIHDTDFVQYLFGIPRAVESRGYARVSGAVDHVATTYVYDGGPEAPLVTAEGSWTMQAGFPFTMHYTVNFEQATAVFDLAAPHPLTVYEPGKPVELIELPAGLGYEHEIAYFLDCVAEKRQPTTVTLAQAADAVRIVEAEVESVRAGRAVPV
jgi:predicted dehydrogenase